jgi:glycosyltransferase involved in cell wall biosynthesis
MHLAFIIDDYLPTSTRVGSKMLHELGLEFIAQGHEVTVITPSVNRQMSNLDVSLLDGVNIWRFSNGPVKDVGKVQRAINETLMSYNAWKAISSRVTKDTFDGVVYYSPSVFFGSLVKKIKKKCECKAYLILRDLFPQWAVDAEIIKEKSLITYYFRYFELLSYNHADAIGLMSLKNLESFQSMHPELKQTHVLFNWAAMTPFGEITEADSMRNRLNLKDKVIFFYGGNIGRAQDMQNLLKLAKGLKNEIKAHFLFIGQGDEFELIKRLTNEWKLDNVTILPSISQTEFKKVLAEVDVGLFSLAKNHTAHNFPGKILGYMVQSLPILGSVNPGNDLQNIINNASAGRVFINGQDEDLLLAAKELLHSLKEREKSGLIALQLLEKYFSVQSAFKTIIRSLT